jgi:hypothetical protein
LKITEGPVPESFSYVKQSWDFFTFLEIMTGWLVPSSGQKLPSTDGPLTEKQVSSGK